MKVETGDGSVTDTADFPAAMNAAVNGTTITDGWVQVGIDSDWNNYTSSRLNIIGNGSFATCGNLSVGYSATLDLSDWGGGENDKISMVSLSKNGNTTPTPESILIVEENTGAIESLGFYNWPSSGIKPS